MPEHVVTVTTVAPRLTAVVAQTTTWDEFPRLWRELLDEVYAAVKDQPVSPRWQNVMLYKDGTPAVEVGVLVQTALPAARGRVIASQLPSGEVATTTHRGDYSGLELAHAAVRRFAERERLRLQSPRWEVYGHHDDRRAPETDIYYLLSPRWSFAPHHQRDRDDVVGWLLSVLSLRYATAVVNVYRPAHHDYEVVVVAGEVAAQGLLHSMNSRSAG